MVTRYALSLLWAEMVSKRWFKPQPKGFIKQQEECTGIDHYYIVEVAERAFGIAF